MSLIIGYKKHLTLCCLLSFVLIASLPGLFCTCLSSREKRDAGSKSTFDTRIVFPLSVNSSSDNNDTVKQHRVQHRARGSHQAALDTIKYGNLLPDHPNRIKSHRKRCRYSDDEFEALKSGVDNNVNYNSNPSGSIQSYYISKAKLNPNPHHIKQPKVRDQFHNHHRPHHAGGSGDSATATNNNIEREILLVNTGDTINLTCHISTTEVDWHFKDRNLTTTVLSYGLQLQVAQPVLFEPTVDTRTDVNYDVIGEDYQSPDDLFEMNSENNKGSANRLQQRNTAYSHHSPHMFKYRVSSDHELTHVLTVYVQGPQDEGSYQCIDSKSESPIKKTIQVYLKSTSALLSSCDRLTTTHLIPIYIISVLYMLLLN